MRRFHIVGVLLLAPAMMLPLMVGCNKEKDKPKSPNGVEQKQKDAVAVAITAPTDAVVKGVVKYKGAAFEPELEPGIKGHKEAALCMEGPGNDTKVQKWLVGKDSGLANVVVSLEPPTGKKYKIDDSLIEPFKNKEVVLDQPFCAYHPHVTAIYAEVQPFVVKNSAKFLHNTNIKPGPKNLPKNAPIEPGTSWAPLKFKAESTPIDISCQLHGFMTAKLWVFNHPYFAVTKDDGSFEIRNVPSGEELIVYMWHESMDKKKEFGKRSFKTGDANTIEGMEISK
jgi:hypothetical protein